ncbi:MAG: hypothetical protein ACREOO_01455 [bacterium]
MPKRFSLPLGFFAIFWGVTTACNEIDRGLAPPAQGITGRITYQGTWPDTTEWVRIAVFKKLPATVLDIPLNPPLFSDTLPRFVSSYDYQLDVPPGTYEWVVLAWKPVKRFAANQFSGLDTLGMYALPGTLDQPLSIAVPDEGQLPNVDIAADFTRLLPVSPILP